MTLSVFPPHFLTDMGEIRYIVCICLIKDVTAVTEGQRVLAFYLEMVSITKITQLQ